MQWLLTLDVENDLIVVCRLMNIVRRKGLKVATLVLASRPAGFSLMAVVDSPEGIADHLFNLLRRTEGVEHVTYYRHETSQDASFVFVDVPPEQSHVGRILEAWPGSKLVFASHGKYLLEIPAEIGPRPLVPGVGGAEFLPLACVKTTRSAPRPELVGA